MTASVEELLNAFDSLTDGFLPLACALGVF